MGMVESQKIRYPSHHPTVLRRIWGLIPSLWSLSVTKFRCGNVDCALEKNSIGAIALWVGDCNGKTMKNLMFSLQGTWHIWHVSCCTEQKCDELPVAFEAQTCSILTKDMDHHVAKCHARPFLRGMSSLWFCFYDAKSWRILWQFGQLCCHSTGLIDCDCGPHNGRW